MRKISNTGERVFQNKVTPRRDRDDKNSVKLNFQEKGRVSRKL